MCCQTLAKSDVVALYATGSEHTIHVASDWLLDLHSAKFSNDLQPKITMLEPRYLP